MSAPIRARGSLQAFQRLTQLSFPRRFVLVQFPNAPLIVAVVADQTAQHVRGSAQPYLSSVGYLAMIVWAYDELAHGVNWFRRLLGLASAVITVIRVAHAHALHS